MNKLLNVLAYLFMAIVVGAGLLVPNLLLDMEEQNVLEKKQVYKTGEQTPISFSRPVEVPRTRILTAKELKGRLLSWEQEWPLTTRGPMGKELTLEQMDAHAREIIKTFTDAGALPVGFATGELTLAGARLDCIDIKKQYQDNIAVSSLGWWEMTYAGNALLFMRIDAESGFVMAMEIELIGGKKLDTTGFSVNESINAYLKYTELTVPATTTNLEMDNLRSITDIEAKHQIANIIFPEGFQCMADFWEDRSFLICLFYNNPKWWIR